MRKFLRVIFILLLYIFVVLIILWKADVLEYTVLEKIKTTDEYIENGLSLEDKNLIIEKQVEDKYYYNQIDDDAKKIYDKLIDSKEELKTGTAGIEFTKGEFNHVLRQENGLELLSQKYQEAVDALRYDHIELYYLDFTKMVLRTITYTRGRDVTYEVLLTLAEGQENYFQDDLANADLNAMIETTEKVSQEILEQADGTDYQKIQYIHDWLIDNLEYDTTYNAHNNRNIYGALVNREVVCEGYAKAFKYLLDKIEIPCILVSGNATNSEGQSEKHMWNYIRINNVWYFVDVTWDDPIITNSNKLPQKYRYKYFCQGDNTATTHVIEKSLTEGGKEFEYPELYHKEQ